LEALKIKGMPQAITKTNFPVRQPMEVEWVRIDNPDPDTDTVRVEGLARGSSIYTRGRNLVRQR
jgi:hypothetical protein